MHGRTDTHKHILTCTGTYIHTYRHACVHTYCIHKMLMLATWHSAFAQTWTYVRRCCEVSPNGRYIAAGCDDSRTAECNGRGEASRNATQLDQPARMYIYDLVSCQCIQECDGHSGRVHKSFEVFHVASGRWAVAGSLEPRPEADHQCREGRASCDADSHRLLLLRTGFQERQVPASRNSSTLKSGSRNPSQLAAVPPYPLCCVACKSHLQM